MKKTSNDRNAGRKPLPYRTKVKRIPIELEPKINKLILEFKRKKLELGYDC